MRPLLLAGTAGALLITGCGSGGTAAAPDPVRLQITAPADLGVVRSASVRVQGIVRPAGAEVTVAGRRATVSGARFSAGVDLAAGINVIDVLASAGSARPALAAVRVRRIVDVRVPDLAGLSPDDAAAQLKGLGLKADTQTSGGGLLDDLFGGDPVVCSTDPPAGRRVDPGTTVTVTVSKSC
ncbi:PASTA domain-containing protein [Baekduia soli]|uniref:PASTA domain-containing protein n=1 Tax=Baekduia soli TaxID=496014 RepID=A0A5B8TZR4_9ACTN|nr:PASTA domain-containing protein [Baekduia soli]QEC46205.1 PASTA domain-containing protein [Baekduia soli]